MGRIAESRVLTIKQRAAWERAHGATQELAAQHAGCAARTLGSWERDDDPDYWQAYEQAWLAHVKAVGVEALMVLREVVASQDSGDARARAQERHRIAAASLVLRHLEATMPKTLHAGIMRKVTVTEVPLALPEFLEG